MLGGQDQGLARRECWCEPHLPHSPMSYATGGSSVTIWWPRPKGRDFSISTVWCARYRMQGCPFFGELRLTGNVVLRRVSTCASSGHTHSYANQKSRRGGNRQTGSDSASLASNTLTKTLSNSTQPHQTTQIIHKKE